MLLGNRVQVESSLMRTLSALHLDNCYNTSYSFTYPCLWCFSFGSNLSSIMLFHHSISLCPEAPPWVSPGSQTDLWQSNMDPFVLLNTIPPLLNLWPQARLAGVIHSTWETYIKETGFYLSSWLSPCLLLSGLLLSVQMSASVYHFTWWGLCEYKYCW